MKLKNPIVMIPSYDTEGYKQYVRLGVSGVIDHRRLRKAIIKTIKDNFGQTVSKSWVRLFVKVFLAEDNSPPISRDERQRRLDEYCVHLNNKFEELDAALEAEGHPNT